jgi:hypothetical protein
VKPNTNIKETKEICNQLGRWGEDKIVSYWSSDHSIIMPKLIIEAFI